MDNITMTIYAVKLNVFGDTWLIRYETDDLGKAKAWRERLQTMRTPPKARIIKITREILDDDTLV